MLRIAQRLFGLVHRPAYRLSAASLGMRVIQLVLSLAVLGIQVRILPLEALGEILLFVNIGLVLAPVFEFGFSHLMLRGQEASASLRRSAAILMGSLFFLGTVVALSMAYALDSSFLRYQAAVVVAAGSASTLFLAAEIRAQNRPLAGLFVSAPLPLLVTICLLALLYAQPDILTGFMGGMTLADACLGSIVVGWAVSAITAYAVATGRKDSRQTERSEVEGVIPALKRQVSSGSGFMLSTVMGLLMAHGGFLILATFSSASDAAIFRIATQCAALLAFGSQAFLGAFAHRFGRLHSDGKTDELQSLVALMTLGSFSFAVVGLFGFAVLGHYLLAVAFSADTVAAWLPGLILCLAQVGIMAAGNATDLLGLAGHQRKVSQITAESLVLLATLGCILAIASGGIGMACAALFSMLWMRIRICVATRNLIGVRVSIIAAFQHLRRVRRASAGEKTYQDPS